MNVSTERGELVAVLEHEAEPPFERLGSAVSQRQQKIAPEQENKGLG